MIVLALFSSILAHAATGGSWEARVVVASPRARLALVELQSADKLQYRACRVFPVYPSDLPGCARVGYDLENTAEVRSALESEFTTQFQRAMDRAARANTPLGSLERALLWGFAGTVLQAALDRVFRGPGLNARELSLGFIGYGSGSLMFDHFFAAQRRQDATLDRRMREMTGSGQPTRLGGTDFIRARRDMGIVQNALKRAIKRVNAAIKSNPGGPA